VRQKVATTLQAAGVLVAAISAASINLTTGGLVLAAGLIMFGVAVERGDS
jgi:hypothetical protein